jgi:GTP-binding protein
VRFVDEVLVTVASGRGGDGAVSFLRARFVPRGGPDGGDGGRGGAVVFVATRQRNTLVDFRWNRTYRAEDGQSGSSQDMTGRDGKDLILYVPVGTQIRELGTERILADMSEEGVRWVVPGGKGGAGNQRFKSATNRTPMKAGEGRPGREFRLHLELKLIADVGLLGFPNAGKSTLISRISAARPKIADYPFTTLVPNLGVVRFAEGESFVVADIPGLIEGASEGAGLGHRFLKHVERCGLYLHLVRVDDDDHGGPIERFRLLNNELRKYDPALVRRPQVVVLTQSDLLPPAEVEARRAALQAESGARVFVISAVTGEGVPALVTEAWRVLVAARRAELPSPAPKPPPTAWSEPRGLDSEGDEPWEWEAKEEGGESWGEGGSDEE